MRKLPIGDHPAIRRDLLVPKTNARYWRT